MRYALTLVVAVIFFGLLKAQEGTISVKLSDRPKTPVQTYLGVLATVKEVNPVTAEGGTKVLAYDVTFARADGKSELGTYRLGTTKIVYWGEKGARREIDPSTIRKGSSFALSIDAKNCLNFIVQPVNFRTK